MDEKMIEVKGDTIDAAIEKALDILGLQREDVEVEVLKNPKSGFLGIGKEPALVRVQYTASPSGKAKAFLEDFLEKFGTPATITMNEDAETKTLNIQLSGNNMGVLIGRRGDTLDAIQYLTGIVANRDEEHRWRVNIDSENYREKRAGTLEALAEKTAQRALKYKKPVALEPMTAHERRIIHTALQGNEAISTYSTGSDPSRRVIISPADYVRPNKGSAPRGGKPQGQGGGNRSYKKYGSNSKKPGPRPDNRSSSQDR